MAEEILWISLGIAIIAAIVIIPVAYVGQRRAIDAARTTGGEGHE